MLGVPLSKEAEIFMCFITFKGVSQTGLCSLMWPCHWDEVVPKNGSESYPKQLGSANLQEALHTDSHQNTLSLGL